MLTKHVKLPKDAVRTNTVLTVMMALALNKARNAALPAAAPAM